MKNQKGITLVALVITIIVLLILAGVSISLVVGNNGVLTQASSSVITNNVAKVKEDLTMALATCETTYYTKWAQNSATTREDIFDKEGLLASELDSKGYTLTVTPTQATANAATTGVVSTAATKILLKNKTTSENYEFSCTAGNAVSDSNGKVNFN